MLKKKTIYIAGIILFTLILILDIAIYLATPKNVGEFDERGFGEIPQGGFTMPEGGEPSNMPDRGEMPEGFDPSEMPNGGEMPEDFDPSNMPNRGNMPEGFDTSKMPNRGELPQMPQENGILASIRFAFIPILIVAIIGDVVCAIMLVVIGKKNKSKEPEAVEQAHIDYNLPL